MVTPPSQSPDDEAPTIPSVEPATRALRVLSVLAIVAAGAAFVVVLLALRSNDDQRAYAASYLALGAFSSAVIFFATALGLELLNGILWNSSVVAAATPDGDAHGDRP